MSTSERQGQLALGLRLSGATVRVFADGVEEMLGRALPRTQEQLAKPEVVNQLIRDYAPAGSIPLPHLENVSLPGVAFGRMNTANGFFPVGCMFSWAQEAARRHAH